MGKMRRLFVCSGERTSASRCLADEYGRLVRGQPEQRFCLTSDGAGWVRRVSNSQIALLAGAESAVSSSPRRKRPGRPPVSGRLTGTIAMTPDDRRMIEQIASEEDVTFNTVWLNALRSYAAQWQAAREQESAAA